jgi:AraC-like DNA-binding protein
MDALSSHTARSDQSLSQLDRLLVTLDVDVQSFALCQVERGRRLVAEPVDAIMVHYVLSGTHFMAVPKQDPVVCSAGSIVLIPPAFRPRVALDDGPSVDILAKDRSSLTREGLLLMDATDGGEAELRFISGIVQASFSGSFGLLDNLSNPIAQHVGDHGIIKDAFGIMVEEIGNPNLGARALTSALMKACLVLMIRRTMAGGSQLDSLFGTLSNKRLWKSLAAVLDRPAHPHTVDTLAEIACMSRSAFARGFKEAFAMSPMDFVGKTRLHHAAQMLRASPLPVKAIAASVGYASRSHFSRAFRLAYGLDPSQFRCHTRSEPTDAPPQRLYS